jgi:hypothetical protein
MKNFPTYVTPKCIGSSIEPYINHTIQTEQIITDDLIQFVKSDCLEFEIFGKKRSSSLFQNTLFSNADDFQVGEINQSSLFLLQEEPSTDIIDPAVPKKKSIIADSHSKNDQNTRELQIIKMDLQAKNKQLKKTMKIAESLKSEKSTLLDKHSTIHNELKSKLNQLQRENQSISTKLSSVENELNLAIQKSKSKLCCIQ